MSWYKIHDAAVLKLNVVDIFMRKEIECIISLRLSPFVFFF